LRSSPIDGPSRQHGDGTGGVFRAAITMEGTTVIDVGARTLIDGSGSVIDVAAVTLLDGPSVKFDDAEGRLIRAAITTGGSFPNGPGILVVTPPGTLLVGSGTVMGAEAGSIFNGSGSELDVEDVLPITIFVTA
jgi:hypothetical protein